jgi:hypothetical protein
MVDTKQDIKISEEMKLEKKIEDMQQQLHDLRYGDKILNDNSIYYHIFYSITFYISNFNLVIKK